jgi:DNA-binding CsgD family transcriptional regulator/tetratricopeptide (TPR) repeat protein
MTTATATILFADVERSTEVRAQIGEQAADRLFLDHERRLSGVVERRRGRVVKTAGDGLMAAFESASDAVTAAVEMQRTVERRDDGLRVRVGIASGDVSWEAGDCFGLPVVTAARLETSAKGGQILVTQVVRWLAGERSTATFEAVGALDLKGLPDPVEAFEVVWEVPGDEGGHGPAVPLPSALATPARVPLVGRVAETAELEEAWGAVTGGGERRLVLISGEAGAGKTRIAAEFARRCHDEGAAVLYGGCDAELAVPYQPWVHALDHLLRALPPDDLDAELVQDLRLLAPLVPRLERGASRSGSPTTALDAETERYRMFVAIDALLAEAARRWPLVVMLDDLHWASSYTLALLHHIAKTGTVGRTLVIGTFRDTGGEVRESLASTLAGLRRLDSVTGLRVGGLDPEDVEALVVGATGQELDPKLRAVARTLAERSRGNPFFVGELWRHLVGSGVLVRGAAGWAVDGDLEGSEVPDSVREVVAGRLGRLPFEVRRLAELVAIAGAELELRVLRAAADLPQADVTAGVDALVAAGLLEAVERPHLAYRFTHALVRDTVVGEVPPAARAGLHLRVGEALEAVHEGDPRPVLADLARHYLEAAAVGPPAKAVYYGRRAADQAVASLAYTEAIVHLLAVQQLTAPGTRAHIEVLVHLGMARSWIGEYQEASRIFESAFHQAREHGFTDLAAEAALGFQDAQQIPGLPGEASLAMVSEAIRLIGADASPLRSRLESAQALALSRVGQLAAAYEALERAKALAGDDPDARTLALWAATLIETDPEELLARGKELEEWAIFTGDIWSAGTSSTNTLRALVALGRHDEAKEALEWHRTILPRLPIPLVEVELRCFECILALADGRFEEAEWAATRGRDAGGDDVPGAEGGYGLQMFAIRRAQGRLAEVAPVLQLAASSAGGVWSPGLAVLYAEVGRLDEARARLEALAPDGFGTIPRDALWPASLFFLAEVCLALDDQVHAAALYDELLPFRGRNLMVALTICFGPGDRLLGGLAGLLGRADLATEHLKAACDLAEQAGAPVWKAEAELQWARFLADRDPPAVRAHASAALAIAEELGMASVAAGARELLDRPMAVEAPSPFPNGLSGREVDVLQLVAAGCSNREIGERLSISANTAANHVRSILQKTASANRAEAAAFAARHDLLAP